MKAYTITVNGNIYNVTVEEGISTQTATAAAPQIKVPVIKAAAPAASPAAGTKVEAPMSGKILAVKAAAGQSVKKGDVIVILEAMKMENDIVAPQDGILGSVNVAVGQQVESGETIAVLQ